MFDVTPDDIAQLTDTDLRELVGRLCEAELSSRGISPAGVTWGGSQTASDGGLDVRVALPIGTSIDGFIPRPATGFQVKRPDMPRGAILGEMRPNGMLRSVIQDLANEDGAYIIVSAHGSTSDSVLQNRKQAMREALAQTPNSERLQTKFYDRTQLATWVRRHPGLIAWVREKIGRALKGWRPYGAWSGPAEGSESDYLTDDTLRLHLGTHHEMPARSIIDAIGQLRSELARPRTVVRLVGLSGVGKTRFVQALFDPRLGSHALATSLAVYTDLADNPDPQPVAVASDLIANRLHAVLVVDNCPPDLHRRLSALCSAPESTISVITVEYDVRDDQPEATQVVTLETSSIELIERLVARRFPNISDVDVRTIAVASDGNARIAIALAETVGRSGPIAGLSDDELFRRLFFQRHLYSDSLLRAAQACSLVYSFNGDVLTGPDAELPRLAELGRQSEVEMYDNVQELLDRQLAQRRGLWRAVLPQALANRLAGRALDRVPYDRIAGALVSGGTPRLARSFSRRLSFLHEHNRAREIVEGWLAPGGFLGDVTTGDENRRAMIENVAPVAPETVVVAFERATTNTPELAAPALYRNRALLRSLAYDPALFDRCCHLLVMAAALNPEERIIKDITEILSSLFPIYLSGTHASIEQRQRVIESLVTSGDQTKIALGMAALDEVLKVSFFSSVYSFAFGARSRDYGYTPLSDFEIINWYKSTISLIDTLVRLGGEVELTLRSLVARQLRGLWSVEQLHVELDSLCRRLAAARFWPEGWTACRQTIQFDGGGQSAESRARLAALELSLRPRNLVDRVRALVGYRGGDAYIDEYDDDDDDDHLSGYERRSVVARELGAVVVEDEAAFTEILPDLFHDGNLAWYLGAGFADASVDMRRTWNKLIETLESLPHENRHVQILRGYLSRVWERESELAHAFLDQVVERSTLVELLPVLQSAVPIDSRGLQRLRSSILSGGIPISLYIHLAFGKAVDHIASADLRELLLLIAERDGGFHVAIEILHMRYYSDRHAGRTHDQELIDVGRELLQRVTFRRGNHRDDHNLAEIIRACLIEPLTAPLAGLITTRLRHAITTYEVYSFDNDDVLGTLLKLHPLTTLDALFGRDEFTDFLSRNLRPNAEFRTNFFDNMPLEALIEWCNIDPEFRYPLAASIITFARRPNEDGPLTWSEVAKALLLHAPDRERVLAVFVDRFRPMSWSGSRAAVMEANMQLLDTRDPEILACIGSLIAEVRAGFGSLVVATRRDETERDRNRDERFE